MEKITIILGPAVEESIYCVTAHLGGSEGAVGMGDPKYSRIGRSAAHHSVSAECR